MDPGKLIKLCRQELNMTQEELAIAAGTTKAAISHYELGRRVPRLAQLQSIAKVLGLSIQDLTEEPDEPNIRIDCAPGGDAVPDEVEWNEEDLFNVMLRDRIVSEPDIYFKEIASYWPRLSKQGRREAAKRVRELSELAEYQEQLKVDDLQPSK